MTDQIESDLEKIRSDLARAFRGVLLCKWDQRFETVLAEFRVDKKDNIRAILERHLSATWDSSNAVTHLILFAQSLIVSADLDGDSFCLPQIRIEMP